MSPVLRRGIRYATVVFLAVRAGLTLIGWMGATLIPDRGAVSVPGLPDDVNRPGLHHLVTAYVEQDALWYLRISEDGYRVDDGSAAFFPGYPLAVRAVSWGLGGRPLLAALLISNLAFLGALIALYVLTAREFSEGVARRTVLYLALFPTSFFLAAPYAESLFLLTAVLGFLAARQARWFRAGLAGAVASATRAIGATLAPAFMVEAIQQSLERRPGGVGRLVRALGWSVAALGGLVATSAYWSVRTGDVLAPLNAQASWSRSIAFPGTTLLRATSAALDGGFPLLDWLITVPILVGAVWVAARCRPAYTVYTWLALLIPLSFAWDQRPLMSMPRFALLAFPAFWAPAVLAERRRLPHAAVVAASAAGLGILSILFINSWFVF